MVSPIDLHPPAGLKQAIYVMECMIEGQTKDQIARSLEGDEQLVTMWIFFLKHNKWMKETSGIWSTTLKGTEWSNRMSAQA